MANKLHKLTNGTDLAMPNMANFMISDLNRCDQPQSIYNTLHLHAQYWNI